MPKFSVLNFAVVDFPALEPHFPQRPEASKPSHQLRRQDDQIGRFRSGESIRLPDQNIHSRSGDALVPMPGNFALLEALLSGSRHLEHRVHFRGDAAKKTVVHGRQRDRLDLQNLPRPRHP